MDRKALESLNRDELIERAESLKVKRARILTRAELVDEILMAVHTRDDAALRRSRGLFGRARDLLARVVERGLHLPDTAERIRNAPPLPDPKRPPHKVVPTVTLAEIYVAQGHKERAIETLEKVLEGEPDHPAATELLERLRSAKAEVPPPRDLGPEDEDLRAPESEEAPPPAATAPVAPPEFTPSPPTVALETKADPSDGSVEEEPAASEPEPATLIKPHVDEVRDPVKSDACVAIARIDGTTFVMYQVREATLEHHKKRAGGGFLSLRVVTVRAFEEGPRSEVQDSAIAHRIGERVLPPAPPPRAVRRVAVGWTGEDGKFVAIAHSGDYRREQGALVEWRPRGEVRSTTFVPSDFAWAAMKRIEAGAGAPADRSP